MSTKSRYKESAHGVVVEAGAEILACGKVFFTQNTELVSEKHNLSRILVAKLKF